MILRLLRFLNHSILRDITRLETANAVLQEHVERGDQERARLWENNKFLQDALETYHRMDKNLEMQARGVKYPPFPDAPHLPVNLVREPDNSPQLSERSQGSHFVTAQNKKFREQTIIKFGLDKTQ